MLANQPSSGLDVRTVRRLGSALLPRENEGMDAMTARLLSRYDAFKRADGRAGPTEVAQMFDVDEEVAVKLLKRFFHGNDVLTREEFKSQISAMHKHPSSQALFDCLKDESLGGIPVDNGRKLDLNAFASTLSQIKESPEDARWAGELFLITLKRLETNLLKFDRILIVKETEKLANFKFKVYSYRLEIFWMVLLVLVTIFCFFWNFFHYYLERTKTYAVFGLCICFARGAGLAINWLMIVVLLSVARSFWTWVRGIKSGAALRFVPIDRMIALHKIAGLSILFFSLIHIGGQVCNFEIVGKSTPAELSSALYPLNITAPISTHYMWTQSIPGTTGIALMVIFAVALPMTIRAVRKTKRFNWFWISHQLLIVFTIILSVHGTSSYFQHYATIFFVIVPLVLYGFDRLYRIYGTLSHSTRAKVVDLSVVSSHVVRIVCEKPKGRAGMAQLRWNTYVPGGYAFINIPSVAYLEWHPFSLCSAPSDETVCFHIQTVGCWTQAVYDTAKAPPSHVYLDGPFGAPSQSYLNYNVTVFVAGGIGVTPYSSILSSLRDESARFRLKKVILVWIVRSADDLDWMKELLLSVIAQCRNMVEIVRFVTDKNLQKRIEEQEGMMTIYGSRPNLDYVLVSAMAVGRQYGTECGVFFTGNEMLGDQIKMACSRLSQNSDTDEDDGFDFHFKREVF